MDFKNQKPGQRPSRRKRSLSRLSLLTTLVVFASSMAFAPQVIAQDDRPATEEGTTLSCAEPPSEMTAWWSFERDGKTKRVPDLTGNQPVGKFKKGVQRVSDSVVGAAVKFDGSGARVQVKKPDLEIGTGDLSVDFWIKTTDADRKPDVIFDNRRNKKSGFHVFTWNGRPGIQVQGQNRIAKASVNDDEWHFVAITVDMTAGTGKFYVNEQVQNFKFNPRGQTSDGAVAMLGRRWRLSGNEPMTGSLDEFEVFNRQLTSSEVEGLYEAGEAGKCRVTVEESKELLAERLGAAFGISSESICECVFESLLDRYDGDLNALYKDLKNFKNQFQNVLRIVVADCNPPCETGNGIAPPENMVGWYPFDLAGEQINGELPALTNTSTTIATGYVGNAALFDGSTSRFDSGATSAFDSGNGDFAIDFWMKTGNMEDPAISIFDSREPSNWNNGFHIYTWRNRIGLQVRGINYSVGTPVSNSPTSETGFRDDMWHLVAVSYDDTNGVASFYLDGDLIGTRAIPNGPDSLDTPNMVIGSSDIGGNVPYEGLLDELELFNAQLSAADVRALHDAGSNGKCKPESIPPVELECTINPTPATVGDSFTASVNPAVAVGWNMGDGSSGLKGSAITYSYAQAGVYSVTYSYEGETYLCDELTINAAPITCVIEGGLPLDVGVSFFIETSDGSVVDWDMGDGTTYDNSSWATHVYLTPGMKTITMITADGEIPCPVEAVGEPVTLSAGCVVEGAADFIGVGDLDEDGDDEPVWAGVPGSGVVFIQTENNGVATTTNWSFVNLQGQTQSDLLGQTAPVTLGGGDWIGTVTVSAPGIAPATAECGLVVSP